MNTTGLPACNFFLCKDPTDLGKFQGSFYSHYVLKFQFII